MKFFLKNWKNILPGDLLFFGKDKKVTHVGISTGGKEFIHQGGMVKTNSLDENSPNFSYKGQNHFCLLKEYHLEIFKIFSTRIVKLKFAITEIIINQVHAIPNTLNKKQLKSLI